MAPNQKQTFATLQSIPNPAEDGVLLAKPFPPLTSLVTSEEVAVDNSSALNESHDYEEKTIEPAEENWKFATLKDLFSAAFIEANLLKESQRLASKKPDGVTIIRATIEEEDVWKAPSPSVEDFFSTSRMIELEAARLASATPVKNVACHDHYWSEGTEAPYCKVNGATDFHWDWSQDATATHVALILKEEWARHLVSAQRMEELLLEDARTRRHYFDQTKAKNDPYWNWESPTTVYADPGTINASYWEWNEEEDSAATLIASIMEYEARRELFSIEHIIEAEVQAVGSLDMASASGCAESDAYWTWSAQEECYWTWNNPVVGLSASNL